MPGWTWVPHLATLHTADDAIDLAVWEIVSDTALAGAHGGHLPDLAIRRSKGEHADGLLRMRAWARRGDLPAGSLESAAGELARANGCDRPLDIHTVYRHTRQFLPVLAALTNAHAGAHSA
ncbi:hypothetical protein AB0M43_37230 [Longispora sp. NPDC051575]|uniref:hypothetical protein n=1 Tax=Longispora sp. NPDC051575 TaxID=3154943 RepID=UPI00342BE1C3